LEARLSEAIFLRIELILLLQKSISLQIKQIGVRYISYTKYIDAKYLCTKYFCCNQIIGKESVMDDLNKGIMVVRLLKQLMDGVRQTVQQEFKESNLTGPQGILVGTLAHHGKMKISELSERVGLSNSTISGILDRLEKQGYIERIRSEEDRRVVYVDVTNEFRKNAKKHFYDIENKFSTIMTEATPEEFDKILEGLNLLKELMDRHLQKKE